MRASLPEAERHLINAGATATEAEAILAKLTASPKVGNPLAYIQGMATKNTLAGYITQHRRQHGTGQIAGRGGVIG